LGVSVTAPQNDVKGAVTVRGALLRSVVRTAWTVLVALAVAGPAATAAPPSHFEVVASFVPPARPGANAAVDVRFTPRDPDVNINEEPAPRLKLEPAQTVLVDKQPPAPKRVPIYDPATAKYLDLALPVSFPVALAADAPKGAHDVKASVVYFYCSKREGWCRKGTSEVEFDVKVP
jgi:hypothetical protein